MTQEEREDFYKLAIEKWGYDAQSLMCIEEMSELTKALCKYKRYGYENAGDEIKYNILEEIADVYNMIDQMAMVFGKDKIEKIRDEKIEKCLKRLKNL